MKSVAIKDNYGNTCWYPINPKTGKPDTAKYHRTDGPAFEGANGSKEWWVNNQRHRTDGPAIEWADGSKAWYVNNQLHRTDGPAYERADGSKAWYLEGKRLTEKEWEKQSARYRTLIGKLKER